MPKQTQYVNSLLYNNSRNIKSIPYEICQEYENEKEDDNYDSNEYNYDQVESEPEKDDEVHVEKLMDEKIQTENKNSDYEEMYF